MSESLQNAISQTFESDGIVYTVSITDLGDGRFAFDIAIDAELSAQIGDIRAFYFDVNGDVDTMGLNVEGSSGESLLSAGTTLLQDEYVVDEADVKRVEEGDTNMNGEVKGSDLFDVGVEFGSSGMAGGDDFQSVSFVLAGAEELTLADFNLQSMGLRLTSVGEADGDRGGSLKISDTFSAIVAADDAVTISESGAVTAAPAAEGSAALNLLANDDDLDGEGVNSLTVVSVTIEGQTHAIPAGGGAFSITSAGGRVVEISIGADGAVAMDPGGAFDALTPGQTDSLTFSYTAADANGVSDAAEATIVITGENEAPLPLADSFAFDETEAGDFAPQMPDANVLANDADPDGDALSVTGFGLPGGALTTPAGGSLTVDVAVLDESGAPTATTYQAVVSIGADGALTVAPDPALSVLAEGQTARAVLNYQVSDGDLSETAEVELLFNGREDPGGPQQPDVSYNVVFLIDNSTSVLGDSPLFAEDAAGRLEENLTTGDTASGTLLDANLAIAKEVLELLGAANPEADIDVGMFGLRTGIFGGEAQQLVDSDLAALSAGGYSAYDADVAAVDTVSSGNSVMSVGVSAANGFFAGHGGASGAEVNLVYYLGDEFVLRDPLIGDAVLTDELGVLYADYEVDARGLVTNQEQDGLALTQGGALSELLQEDATRLDSARSFAGVDDFLGDVASDFGLTYQQDQLLFA